MSNMPTEAIILGSGSSISPNIEVLQGILVNRFVIACNYCYSEDTEVFTDSGWKYFKNLNETEKVLTRNYDGTVQWIKPIKYIKQYYSGEMINVNNKLIDLLVTPNHDFYLLKKRNIFKHNQYIQVSATYFNYKKIGSEYKIPKNFKWVGNDMSIFILPLIIKMQSSWIHYKNNKLAYKQKTDEEIKISMKYWIRFLGIFLSEGYTCYQDKTKHFYIGISQSKKANHKKYKLIEKLLNTLPFHWQKTDSGFVACNKQLYSYLVQFGKSHDKFIPKNILNLNNYYLKKLLFWLMLGDGHRNKKTFQKRYFTASKQLASDVQELFYKTGTSANIYIRNNSSKSYNTDNSFIYDISECRHYTHLSVSNIKSNTIKYIGYIYDITIESTHTLFVRRNGKCCWSGNSYKHFPCTFLAYQDRDFYKTRDVKDNPDIYDELKQLQLIVGINQNGVDEFKLPNTILLPKEEKESLTGVFALKLALRLMERGKIFLCGFDWDMRKGLPERDPNYNPYSDQGIHYYSKEEINHRGQNYVGYFENHNSDKIFSKFIKKDVEIFNVSPESNINCFPKITYNQMFSLMNDDNNIMNQDELRKEIKLLLSE